MTLGRDILYLCNADIEACGLSLAEVAVAAAVYERAAEKGIGRVLPL